MFTGGPAWGSLRGPALPCPARTRTRTRTGEAPHAEAALSSDWPRGGLPRLQAPMASRPEQAHAACALALSCLRPVVLLKHSPSI